MRYSKVLMAVLFIGGWVSSGYGQGGGGLVPSFVDLAKKGEKPDSLASKYRIDFTIPDAPAFKLLDGEPSDILRPATVKEFGANLSSFIDDENGISIPKAFAIEFAPGLLVGGKDLSLRKYNSKDWWYRLRISAGTKRLGGEGEPSQIAYGMRTSLIDNADLRGDSALINKITGIATEILGLVEVGPPPIDGSGAEVVEVNSVKIDSLNKALKSYIDSVKSSAESRWNRTALDVAAAVRMGAQNPEGKNLRLDEWAGWVTYARGWGGNSQWLAGVKVGSERDQTSDDMELVLSVPLRLYVGSNQLKMFGETQFKTMEAGETVLFNGGGEVKFTGGTWATFGGGGEWDMDKKEWNLVSKFSIKIGLPSEL